MPTRSWRRACVIWVAVASGASSLQPIRKIVRKAYAAAESVFRHFPDRLLGGLRVKGDIGFLIGSRSDPIAVCPQPPTGCK